MIFLQAWIPIDSPAEPHSGAAAASSSTTLRRPCDLLHPSHSLFRLVHHTVATWGGGDAADTLLASLPPPPAPSLCTAEWLPFLVDLGLVIALSPSTITVCTTALASLGGGGASEVHPVVAATAAAVLRVAWVGEVSAAAGQLLEEDSREAATGRVPVVGVSASLPHQWQQHQRHHSSRSSFAHLMRSTAASAMRTVAGVASASSTALLPLVRPPTHPRAQPGGSGSNSDASAGAVGFAAPAAAVATQSGGRGGSFQRRQEQLLHLQQQRHHQPSEPLLPSSSHYDDASGGRNTNSSNAITGPVRQRQPGANHDFSATSPSSAVPPAVRYASPAVTAAAIAEGQNEFDTLLQHGRWFRSALRRGGAETPAASVTTHGGRRYDSMGVTVPAASAGVRSTDYARIGVWEEEDEEEEGNDGGAALLLGPNVHQGGSSPIPSNMLLDGMQGDETEGPDLLQFTAAADGHTSATDPAIERGDGNDGRQSLQQQHQLGDAEEEGEEEDSDMEGEEDAIDEALHQQGLAAAFACAFAPSALWSAGVPLHLLRSYVTAYPAAPPSTEVTTAATTMRSSVSGFAAISSARAASTSSSPAASAVPSHFSVLPSSVSVFTPSSSSSAAAAYDGVGAEESGRAAAAAGGVLVGVGAELRSGRNSVTDRYAALRLLENTACVPVLPPSPRGDVYDVHLALTAVLTPLLPQLLAQLRGGHPLRLHPATSADVTSDVTADSAARGGDAADWPRLARFRDCTLPTDAPLTWTSLPVLPASLIPPPSAALGAAGTAHGGAPDVSAGSGGAAQSSSSASSSSEAGSTSRLLSTLPLGMVSPPPLASILAHMQALSDAHAASLRGWAFKDPPVAVYSALFKYLTSPPPPPPPSAPSGLPAAGSAGRGGGTHTTTASGSSDGGGRGGRGGLPSTVFASLLPSQQAELRFLHCIPAGHALLPPSQVFFRLPDPRLSPLLAEVPRAFGVYDALLTALGVREAPSPSTYRALLGEVAEGGGAAAVPLCVNELQAVLVILASMAGASQSSLSATSSSTAPTGGNGSASGGGDAAASDSMRGAAQRQLQQQRQEQRQPRLWVPDEAGLLVPREACVFPDDPWLAWRLQAQRRQQDESQSGGGSGIASASSSTPTTTEGVSGLRFHAAHPALDRRACELLGVASLSSRVEEIRVNGSTTSSAVAATTATVLSAAAASEATSALPPLLAVLRDVGFSNAIAEVAMTGGGGSDDVTDDSLQSFDDDGDGDDGLLATSSTARRVSALLTSLHVHITPGLTTRLVAVDAAEAPSSRITSSRGGVSGSGGASSSSSSDEEGGDSGTLHSPAFYYDRRAHTLHIAGAPALLSGSGIGVDGRGLQSLAGGGSSGLVFAEVAAAAIVDVLRTATHPPVIIGSYLPLAAAFRAAMVAAGVGRGGASYSGGGIEVFPSASTGTTAAAAAGTISAALAASSPASALSDAQLSQRVGGGASGDDGASGALLLAALALRLPLAHTSTLIPLSTTTAAAAALGASGRGIYSASSSQSGSPNGASSGGATRDAWGGGRSGALRRGVPGVRLTQGDVTRARLTPTRVWRVNEVVAVEVGAVVAALAKQRQQQHQQQQQQQQHEGRQFTRVIDLPSTHAPSSNRSSGSSALLYAVVESVLSTREEWGGVAMLSIRTCVPSSPPSLIPLPTRGHTATSSSATAPRSSDTGVIPLLSTEVRSFATAREVVAESGRRRGQALPQMVAGARSVDIQHADSSAAAPRETDGRADGSGLAAPAAPLVATQSPPPALRESDVLEAVDGLLRRVGLSLAGLASSSASSLPPSAGNTGTGALLPLGTSTTDSSTTSAAPSVLSEVLSLRSAMVDSRAAREAAEAAATTLRAEVETLKSTFVCSICTVAEVDSVLIPCGHTMCSACVRSLREPRCPWDRSHVQTAIPFFRPR